MRFLFRMLDMGLTVFSPEHGQVDQKAKRLAAKVSENQTIVEQLRQERDGLTRDHAELQSRYSKITDVSAQHGYEGVAF